MSAQIPETVWEAWGQPAVRDFTAWLEGVMAERAVGRDEFGALDTRLTGIDDRLTGVETQLTVLEHDVTDIKVEFREQRREMNERFDRVNERFDQLGERMASQMRWSVSILAIVATLVTILVGLGQLMP